MDRLPLPVCSISDLPRLFCAHCQPIPLPTDEERAYMASMITTEPLPNPTGVLPIFYHSQAWHSGSGKIKIINCDHNRRDGPPLCSACLADFHRVLSDVSGLVTELEIHLTRQSKFLELGTPTEADPEEASMPWNEQASKAIRGFWRALGGRPVPKAKELLEQWHDTTRLPNLAELAGRVSYAAIVARAVIDSPRPKVYYGPCPDCLPAEVDIYQERVAEGEWVRHSCGYHARRADHLRAELDIMADKQFTLTKLVQTLNDGGEPTSRQQIENLIYRANGDLPPLPREKVPMPRWVGNKLERNEVFVYRLGTVREFLAAKKARV